MHRSLRFRPSRARGFTLLIALGVVALVTMSVMLSYSVVGREADTQGDSRRQKEAFFAAEAGLAEGREALRLRAGPTDETYNAALSALRSQGLAVTDEPGLGDATRPWYELLRGGGDRWNYLRLVPANMAATELASQGNQPYVNYPTQEGVRYRVFVRDDADDGNGTVDSNGRVWVISIGEVVNSQGRPTRAVVQALVANQNLPGVASIGCTSRGCGPDNTFNNTNDQQAPVSGVVRTIP